MRQKFEKFMQGRYGIDHFSRFLLVGALVCILLSGLLRASALNYVSWILLIWMYYRMFSKNIRKRCEEERMYMDTKEKVIRFCKGDKSVISDSKHTKSTAVRIADRKSVSREGREKLRSPVLPAAVNLSNGPDSCSFCMNLLKIAGNMLVHHRKKYYT